MPNSACCLHQRKARKPKGIPAASDTASVPPVYMRPWKERLLQSCFPVIPTACIIPYSLRLVVILIIIVLARLAKLMILITARRAYMAYLIMSPPNSCSFRLSEKDSISIWFSSARMVFSSFSTSDMSSSLQSTQMVPIQHEYR